MANKSEEKALRREIGSLIGPFGIGARIVARFLPTEVAEDHITVVTGGSDTNEFVLGRLAAIGRNTDEFCGEMPPSTISVFVGSGNLNLNPTIVHLTQISEDVDGTTFKITALAKEGAVKQDSAKKAIERVKKALAE